MPLLAAWHVSLLVILFVLVCLFLMLVILIQRPRGEGLSGAFGGMGGGAQSMFGAKVGDVLTWFTVICFAGFLLLAMGLTWAIRPETDVTANAPQVQESAPAPAAPVTTPLPPATTQPAAEVPAAAPAAAAPATQPASEK